MRGVEFHYVAPIRRIYSSDREVAENHEDDSHQAKPKSLKRVSISWSLSLLGSILDRK
jgi:hypothetical protein